MNLRNRVNLIGNLGKEPEIKQFENNKLAKFTLATNESRKNKSGEYVQETQWHNVTAWGKTAEFVEKHLKKGSEIALEGRLSYNSYEDKDGQKKYITEVIVNDLLLLKSKQPVKEGDLPF